MHLICTCNCICTCPHLVIVGLDTRTAVNETVLPIDTSRFLKENHVFFFFSPGSKWLNERKYAHLCTQIGKSVFGLFVHTSAWQFSVPVCEN